VQNSYAPIIYVAASTAALASCCAATAVALHAGTGCRERPACAGDAKPSRCSISIRTAGRTFSSLGTTAPRWPSTTTAWPAGIPAHPAAGTSRHPTAVGARITVELMMAQARPAKSAPARVTTASPQPRVFSAIRIPILRGTSAFAGRRGHYRTWLPAGFVFSNPFGSATNPATVKMASGTEISWRRDARTEL